MKMKRGSPQTVPVDKPGAENYQRLYFDNADEYSEPINRPQAYVCGISDCSKGYSDI